MGYNSMAVQVVQKANEAVRGFKSWMAGQENDRGIAGMDWSRAVQVRCQRVGMKVARG